MATTHDHRLPPNPDDESDPEAQDDAVIGEAFKRHLSILAILFAIGLLIGWWLKREAAPAEERKIEATAPETVDAPLAQAPDAPFIDVTATAGIGARHFNGARGEKFLPETMGGGAAFFDYDNDGDADLLLVNGAPWPGDAAPDPTPTTKMYRNRGDGTFDDVSSETGLDLVLYGQGVAVGDIDGDGWLDLLITAVGTNRLLRNVNGRFADITARAGVGGEADAWSTCATFFDLDRDGDLDLFVCNYVRWSPEIDRTVDYQLTGVGRAYGPPVNYAGTFSQLYINRGDGTFDDKSETSGVQVRNQATGAAVGKALGVAPLDVDGDGQIDLLIANDTVQNFLLHNQGDGTFQEMGELYGIAYGRAGEATGAMGIDAGHYRNDADLGFAIGNFANEMTSLYVSQGEATLFADEAISDGVGAPSRRALTFGVLLIDYDLDGRLDLLQTNGHLENEINTVDPSQTFEQPGQLMWNAGDNARQSFVVVPPDRTGALARPIVGRASATADIDLDGDLDLILTQTGRQPLLLRNEQQLGHHWLRVRLHDGDSANSGAIGAWLELTIGDKTQRRQVMPTRSYLSQSELAITFGLGDATDIDRLDITWPDGHQQSLSRTAGDVPRVDTTIVIERR